MTLPHSDAISSASTPSASSLMNPPSLKGSDPAPIEITTTKAESTCQSDAGDISSRSSAGSLFRSSLHSDEEWPSTPTSEPVMDEDKDHSSTTSAVKPNQKLGRPRQASTSLLFQAGGDLEEFLGSSQTGTKFIRKFCCGGGCHLMKSAAQLSIAPVHQHLQLPLPDNNAFRSLGLRLGDLGLNTNLTSVEPLPHQTITFAKVERPTRSPGALCDPARAPSYLQPHPPYHIFHAPVYNVRELTKPGAEKRTYHFDVDVTDYPDEGGIDFKVGGAVGVCPPNEDIVVEEIFDRLGVPQFVRDKSVIVQTSGGRWPTMWGEEQARALHATRRELLTWCCDLQSTGPTKSLIRVLAEYATDAHEKKILTYLVSAEGQGAFCDLRTGPYVTLSQLLHAFPSSCPPLETLMSQLDQLKARFYSLSNDPHISSSREGLDGRRLIELAVTVRQMKDWKNRLRTGVGSGYLERIAHTFIQAKADHPDEQPDICIPLFRGLMKNPLSREFITDGPMMLIGAGVGMAPFRGFILNRLKNANCANKIWLLQGVRDSALDEIYCGELGHEESQIKRVVQSRKTGRLAGEAKYVQDEVLHQADIVCSVINAVDGRIFVCGSSQGMGEGVHEALISVTMAKHGLTREQSEAFWAQKKEDGQYIAVGQTFFPSSFPRVAKLTWCRKLGDLFNYALPLSLSSCIYGIQHSGSKRDSIAGRSMYNNLWTSKLVRSRAVWLGKLRYLDAYCTHLGRVASLSENGSIWDGLLKLVLGHYCL